MEICIILEYNYLTMINLPIFDPLSKEEKDEIVKHCIQQVFPGGTELLKEGQFVNVVPVVISGLIKVYTRNEDREMLLYYIQPGETCVMSYTSAIRSEPSKVYAVTEEETEVGLLPRDPLRKWVVEFPAINEVFLNQYNLRYMDLLNAVAHITFNKIETRLLNHLIDLTLLKQENPIKISHKKLASELGTAREVITRTLKKLETEEKINQTTDGILIIR